MYEIVRLGRGIIKEVDPIENILNAMNNELDKTISTARKYWPTLF